MMVVALVAWIVFWDHDCLYYAASIVTAISGSMAMLWFTSTERKWGDFLTSSDARITARFDNIETLKSERTQNSIPKEAVNGSFQQNAIQNNNDDARSGSEISLDLSSFAIGELIKEERKLVKMTQEQLADKIGAKKSFISRIENGHSDIQLSTLFKLVEFGLGRKINFTIQ